MSFDYDLLEYLESYLTKDRMQRFNEVLSQRTNYITIAMEDVFQLHNTSAVIRSCDAFGFQNLHVIENRFGKRLDRNIAMGAQQWVDVYRYATAQDCISNLRDKGYKIVATVPHDHAIPLKDYVITAPIALFFGTERNGLSKEVLDAADEYLVIPMVGFTESINISVAAAIIGQQLGYVLRKSDKPWVLPNDEMLRLRLEWVKKSIKSVDQIIARFNQSRNLI